jgi:hypothetical protein
MIYVYPHQHRRCPDSWLIASLAYIVHVKIAIRRHRHVHILRETIVVVLTLFQTPDISLNNNGDDAFSFTQVEEEIFTAKEICPLNSAMNC